MSSADPASAPGEGPGGPLPLVRRSRLRRWVLLVAGLAAALVMSTFGLIAGLPWVLTPDRLTVWIEELASEALGAPLTIGSLRYHPFWGFEAKRIRLGPPPGFGSDVFDLATLGLFYDLSAIRSKRITIERLEIREPNLVIETRAGKTNLAALAERFPRSPAKPPAPPPAPARLSPLAVILDRAELVGGRVRMIGEGPKVDLVGLRLELSGAIDPRTVFVRLRLRYGGPGSKPGQLSLDVPPKEVGAPFSLRSSVNLDLTVTASAGASANLALGEVLLKSKLELLNLELDRGTERQLPPLDLALLLDLALRGDQDQAQLLRLNLSLDGRPLLDLSGGIAGVLAAVEELSSLGAAAALSLGLGWKRSGGGRVHFASPELRISLDELAPILTTLLPDLALAGTVGVGPLSVAGTIGAFRAQHTEALAAKLMFDRFSLVVPSRGLQLEELVGVMVVDQAQAERAGPPAPGLLRMFPYQLDGSLRARRLGFGAHRAEQVGLELKAGLEEARYPNFGESAFSARVFSKLVSTVAAEASDLRLDARLAGRDLFARQRRGPVDVQLAAQARRISVGTGTSAASAEGLEIQLSAEPDQLLVAAVEPVPLKLAGYSRSLEAPGAGSRASLVKVLIDLLADDPRSGADTTARGALGFSAAVLQSPQIEALRPEAKLRFSAGGLRLLPAKGSIVEGPIGALSVELSSAVEALTHRSPDRPSITSGLKLDLVGKTSPREGTATISRLHLRAEDFLDLTLAARGIDLFRETRGLDGDLKLHKLDLGSASARLSEALFPQVRLAGSLSAEASFSGRPADLFRLSEDLTRVPVNAHLKVLFEGVGAGLPAHKAAFSGLFGPVSVNLAPGKALVEGELALASVSSEAEGSRFAASGTKLLLSAGLRDREWIIDGQLEADALGAQGSAQEQVRGATIRVDLVHPMFGEVLVRSLDVRAPSAGVTASLSGRLGRRKQGVLRPDLKLAAKIDLDRLKALVPPLKAARGNLGAEVTVASPDDVSIDLRGVLDLVRFGYQKDPSSSIENATGRVPIIQRLYLEAPDDRLGLVAVREVFGDDLLARCLELKRDLLDRSCLAVDTTDVLVDAPRSPDYEALRPFFAKTGPRVDIERLTFGRSRFEALSLDALYQSGVLRVDRLAMHLWEGDIFAEFAAQLTAEQQLRVRMRGTVTDVNLDVPFAAAKGVEPAADPAQKALYQISGVLDLKLEPLERQASGSLDVSKMGPELFVRVIDAIDPHGVDEKLQASRRSLEVFLGTVARDIIGVSLEGIRIWIDQNLLNLDFVWARPLFDFLATSDGGTRWLPRIWLPVTQAAFGTPIVEAVNATAIKRRSLNELWERPFWASLAQSIRNLPVHLCPLDRKAAGAKPEVERAQR